MSKLNPTPPVLTEQDIQRFWSHVDKSPGQGPKGDCWEWIFFWHRQGAKKQSKWYSPKLLVSDGGTTISRDGRLVKASRLSMYLATGKWPSNFGCHKCDNSMCVRPEHLFDGTHQENMADMVTKGRHVSHTRPDWNTAAIRRAWALGTRKSIRGSQHVQSKLTDADIPVIRVLYAKGDMSQAAIGLLFGVDDSTISAVVRGERWAHIT